MGGLEPVKNRNCVIRVVDFSLVAWLCLCVTLPVSNGSNGHKKESKVELKVVDFRACYWVEGNLVLPDPK